jgi:hypothetical protein
LNLDYRPQFVRGETSHPLLASVATAKHWRPSVAGVFGAARDGQKAALKLASVHTNSIVGYDNAAMCRIAKIDAGDCYQSCVGVIGILDQLDESGTFFGNQQFAELLEELGIDAEARHLKKICRGERHVLWTLIICSTLGYINGFSNCPSANGIVISSEGKLPEDE